MDIQYIKKYLIEIFCVGLLEFATMSVYAGGWDYDLKTKCAKDVANNVVAGANSCSTNRRWTVAIQSERGFDRIYQCPYGTTDNAFPVNSGGPATMGWYSHSSDLGPNWTVNMVMDNVHPNSNVNCVDEYFNSYIFKDEADFNGYTPPYLPNPNDLVSSYVFVYNDYLSNSNSAARMLLGAEVWWDGKVHIVEIDAVRSGGAYAKNPDIHGVISAEIQPNLNREYVVLDGPSWGVNVNQGQVAEIYIPWKDIFAYLRNSINPITQATYFGGMSANPDYKTKTVYIGTETYGRAIANLWQTNFRIAP